MTRFIRRTLLPVLPLLLLLLAAGCSDSSTGPGADLLEIAILSGNAQLTTAGAALSEPLEVLVRRTATGQPVHGIDVGWRVLTGSGVMLAQSVTTTDSLGRTSIGAVLGTEIGAYAIEADFEGRSGSPSRFDVFTVRVPVILMLPVGPVQAGEVIRIRGENFSPTLEQNMVFFATFRGQVLSGDSEELEVRVPACLPTGSVGVSVAFGPTIIGTQVPLQVAQGGSGVQMAVGEHRVIDDSDALSCLLLPSAPGARYLAVAHSTSVVASGDHSFVLFGLTGSGPVTTTTVPPSFTVAPETSLSPQAAWDRDLRRREKELLERARDVPPAESAAAYSAGPGAVQAATPALGSRRDFNVLNRSSTLERVTAEVRHVSQHAIIYEDVRAPDGGLTSSDFAEFAADFDDPIFTSVTGVFGNASDLDGNGRIIILFTPAVNQLTAAGSQGFVGGFFYGLDLLPNREGSNRGEIFYTLVPDPLGVFGDPRPKTTVLRVVPAVLAHEFQHMVHFNERVLVRLAASTESLWLSEALAQMAEDVVAEEFQARGDDATATRYAAGNLDRARLYMADPSRVSLIPTTGGGTLRERGGGWLLLRYLRGQSGTNQILGNLTRTTQTGTLNVTGMSGREWPELMSSWSAALYTDDLGLPLDPRLEFGDIRLREALTTTGAFPLRTRALGPGSFNEVGRVRSSAPAHFVITPGTGGTALVLARPHGFPLPETARLRLTLVRVE